MNKEYFEELLKSGLSKIECIKKCRVDNNITLIDAKTAYNNCILKPSGDIFEIEYALKGKLSYSEQKFLHDSLNLLVAHTKRTVCEAIQRRVDRVKNEA